MPDDIISLEMSGPLAGVLHQQVKMEILVNRFQIGANMKLFYSINCNRDMIEYDFLYVSFLRLPPALQTSLPSLLAAEAKEPPRKPVILKVKIS